MSVIEKLDSVLANWRSKPFGNINWNAAIETCADDLDALMPAIRQDMIDARRYRFLRRKDAWKETYFATTGGISAIFVSDGRTGHATDTEMLDAAIDARLASDSEGGE